MVYAKTYDELIPGVQSLLVARLTGLSAPSPSIRRSRWWRWRCSLSFDGLLSGGDAVGAGATGRCARPGIRKPAHPHRFLGPRRTASGCRAVQRHGRLLCRRDRQSAVRRRRCVGSGRGVGQFGFTGVARLRAAERGGFEHGGGGRRNDGGASKRSPAVLAAEGISSASDACLPKGARSWRKRWPRWSASLRRCAIRRRSFRIWAISRHVSRR